MGNITVPKAQPDTQLFRDVFNASPMGIAVENLEGQPLFVNHAFCSFLGFSEEELRNKHCVDFSPPEDAEKDWALFQQLRAGVIDHYQLEKRYFRRDRSLVWGRLSVSLLKGGPFSLVLAMVEDITEKKAAEETRFRQAAIIESSGDAIVSGNLDGTIVSWNAGAEKIYGYTEAEAVGQRIHIIVPPELGDEESAILETIRTGGRIDYFETVRVTKAGKRLNVSLSIAPIKNSSGQIVGISGIARDITERKRAVEALREVNRALEEKNALLQAREELLRVFVKNVPASVAMLDRDLRYLQVSDRWCSDNSVESSELLGRSREVFPEMPERWKEVNRRALEGETLRADEDRWESGGRTRWARWEVRPWRNPDGTVGGILILAEDITRRKQMEEELSGMGRKLIESQEQERARIARELHDDVGQRLALLNVELEQLKENPSEILERVQNLRKQTIEISADLQALSHELHSSKLEYLGAVAGMKSWCREFGERQGMQIDCKSNVLSPLPPEVGLCLFRVLQEALHNGAKHSGVKRIEAQLWEESGEIHLAVSDSGRGFDLDEALRGGGLGLTSMRERIRLVNGSIAIQSKPMGGTTIHVSVPLASGHEQQRAAG
jgi:PAS domain S-box-containing protein